MKKQTNSYAQIDAVDVSSAKMIRLTKDPTYCLRDYYSRTENGTNIELNLCKNAQKWMFDKGMIIMETTAGTSSSKCISLNSTSSPPNGDNIHLWDCKGKPNQKWIYDGVKKIFRSELSKDKCLSIQDSDPHVANNIHLWDCKTENENQIFEIY